MSASSKPELSDSKLRSAIVQSKTDQKEKIAHATDEKLERIFRTLEHDISNRLNAVLDLLDLEHGREDMCCAADLVAYAIDVGWLDQSDFFLS
jgi:serine/threonine-protein kinase haspin